MDNRDTPPEHRLDAFRQQTADYGDPWKTYPHTTPPGEFLGQAMGIIGANTLVGFRKATPVRRTLAEPEAELYRDAPPKLRLGSHPSGRGRFEARGQSHPFGPRVLIPTLTDEPSTLRYDTNHHLVFADVPVDQLSLSLPVLRRATFRVCATSATAYNLFFGSVQSILNAGRLDPDGVDVYLSGMVDLVIRTTLGLDPDHTDTQTARRHQIEHHVREHITDPNLGATTIAQALRVSPRLIYQLFQNHTETLAELIQRTRVEHAKHLLATTHPHNLTIDQIAQQSGFGSTRTLTRAFQRATGNTPTHYARNHQPTRKNRARSVDPGLRAG